VHAVQTDNLTKIYGQQKIALNGVSMQVDSGSIFGFLGPNGAGKTTALRLMLGLQRPTAGAIDIFGERVGPNSAELRRRIGYLPTNPEFPPEMTPITYLDFVGRLCDMGAQDRNPRLAGLIRAVGLLPAESQRIGTFSTGMRTRLGIAASLMNDPELLLWDEPCSGLDPTGRRHTMDLITWLGQTKTIVIASHILGDIDQVCTHVGVLSEGQLVFSGPMEEMKRLIHVETVTIEIEGGDKSLAAFEAVLTESKAIDSFERDVARFGIRAHRGQPLTDTIDHILALVRESGAGILAMSTGWGRVEDAYLQMLERDDARGFLRAYGENGGEADAAVCDTPRT